MADDFDLAREQKAISIRVAIAVSVVAAAIATIGFMMHGEPANSGAERLRSFAFAAASVAVWLPLTMANVMRLRFFSAEDIEAGASGEESDKVKAAASILENTLEQAVLALVVYGLATYAVPHPQPLLASSAMLFAVGRMLFWKGYTGGASRRALGFALTFFSTIGAMLVSCVFLFV